MLREEREKRRRRGKGGRSRVGAAEFAAAVALPCHRKARTARERTAKREGDRISSPRSQRRRRPHRGSTPSRLATAATTKLAVVAIEAEERERVCSRREGERAHTKDRRRTTKREGEAEDDEPKGEGGGLFSHRPALHPVTVAIALYAVCSCHHPPRSSHLLTEYYGSGETKKVSWRESQLKGLRRFLIEKEEDILKALMLDLGKHQVEAFRDEAKLPQIALLSSAEIVPEPLGLVVIISSWNFPFGLSLEPLIGAVAAGNTVVLKPSELSPACSSILVLGLPNFLDLPIIRLCFQVILIQIWLREAIFRVIAAILHLGNINFAKSEEETDSSVLENEESKLHLQITAELLMCDPSALEDALCKRVMITPEEVIKRSLDPLGATVSRDGLAKTLYSCLFDWLVQKINVSIGQDPESKCLIGVLDIYGFESFKNNSFEQFCINFTNEKLQQHFNQHVFKMEQERYTKKGLTGAT
ncbi:uncharacterized protein DS421_15g505130 [Arachis hypogaea]|nr:uncharacterized protein DS421_15g505130 [Arachis hypogaea]